MRLVIMLEKIVANKAEAEALVAAVKARLADKPEIRVHSNTSEKID